MPTQWKCSKRPFKDTWIRAIRSDCNLQISDTTIPGLFMRYSASTNKKVFYLGYRLRNSNKSKNLLIGRYSEFNIKEIKDRAITFRQQILDGRDPMQERLQKLIVEKEELIKKQKVKDLFAQYMDKYAKQHKKPATIKSNENQIRLYIEPVLGDMYVSELKLSHLIDFYNDLAQKTSFSTANKVIWLISSFWNWCESYEYLPLNSNPCAKIDKKKNEPIKYEILDADGYRRLFQAIEEGPKESDFSERCFRAIKLLMLTGCRYSEITELEKDEINFNRQILDLKDSKVGAREVPLSDAAIQELKIALEKANQFDTKYVFPGIRDVTKPLCDLRKAFEWALKRAKLPHMRLHDLRHSFITAGSNMGENATALQVIAGHSDLSTTQKYIHLSQKRAIQTANNVTAEIYAAQ